MVVALLTGHNARTGPAAAAATAGYVASRRPITGERTVLPVLRSVRDDRGRTWLEVRLPGRVLGGPPLPRLGWIVASRTRRWSTPWHIVVKLEARAVLLYRAGRRTRTFAAVVGKHSTPTPHGEYFVEENVRLPSYRPGAPFALATSARSSVLQEFDGGPGQIAIHGRGNLGGALGTATSHGCLRLSDRAVTMLATRIAPGTPLTIT
jgi:hypothetical protein